MRSRVFVVVFFVVAVSPAPAAELPRGWTCARVRAVIDVAGEAGAESVARGAGWTDEQIRAARECRRGRQR